MHRQVHVHVGMRCKFNHYMHACFARNYPEALSIVAMGMTLLQLPNSVINIADITSALDESLASQRFRRKAVNGAS